MPIEIRELVIRAAIEEQKPEQTRESPNSGGYNKLSEELRIIREMIQNQNER